MALNKRKVLDAAQKYLQKGNLDKALKEYQKVLDADPRDTNVRLKVGDVQLRRGKSEDAVDAYLEVAKQFMKNGFDAKAVALFKQITKIDEKRYDIYEPLAELYQRLGLTSEAMSALQTAADAYQREGKKKEGLALLRKMASLDPSNTATRLKIAEMLWKAELAEEALAEYDEVVVELGRQGDHEGVVRVHEAVLRHVPERIENLIGLGTAQLELGHPDRAEVPLLKATEVAVESIPAWEAMARAHEALGRRKDCEDAWKTVAAIHKDRGNDEKAKEILQLYVTAAGFGENEDGEVVSDAVGGTTIGELGMDPTEQELEIGSEPEAAPAPPAAKASAPAADVDLDDEIEIELDEEVDEEPSAAPAARSERPAAPEADAEPSQLLAEAGVYLRYSQHDKAVACLERVLEAVPGHLEALEKLGEARLAMGDRDAALVLWKEGADYARQGGNQEAFDVLCERVRDLDEQAAEALAAEALQPALSEAEPEPDVDLELAFDTPSGEPELRGDELSGIDLEIDLLDDGFPPNEDSNPSLEVATQHPDFVASEAEPDAEPEPGSQPAAEAGREASAEDLADQFDVPAGGVRIDGSDSGEIPAEDLEEAEFYFRQGLLDEAQTILKRLLEISPNHPQVLLRLGEIAKSRGESPSDAVADGADFDTTEEETHPGVSASDSTVEDLDAKPELGEPDAGPDDETVQVDPDDLDDVDVHFDDDDDATLGGETAPQIDVASGADDLDGDEGFDLAAELEDVFDPVDGGVSVDEGIGGTTQAGFQSIFQSFKQGVKETLGEGEYETHYDLGIAYREMGLLEDAINEFAAALPSPARKLDCLSMMGLCALDLGKAEDSISYLEQVLSAPDLDASRAVGIEFDLGRAYKRLGDVERARELWTRVHAADPGFQDVAERLQGLGNADSSPSLGELEPDEPRGMAEVFESFDDVIAEAEADVGDAERDDGPDDGPDDPDDGPADPGSTQWRRKISYG